MNIHISKPRFFTTQHHLDENGIALYVDALKLDRLQALPNEVLQHVEECETCKLQIIEVNDLMISDVFQKELQHPFLEAAPAQRRAVSTQYKIAALFVLFVCIGLLSFLIFSHTSSLPEVSQKLPLQQDSGAIIAEQTTTTTGNASLADNFSPSPNLDDLVRTDFRSSSLEVISPENDAILKSPMKFRWKLFGRPVKLKILTNRELTLLTTIVKNNSFVTEKIFEPGLYYWKLESEGELLFVGKFFVQ